MWKNKLICKDKLICKNSLICELENKTIIENKKPTVITLWFGPLFQDVRIGVMLPCICMKYVRVWVFVYCYLFLCCIMYVPHK